MKKCIVLVTGCVVLASGYSVSYSAEGPYLSIKQGFALMNDYKVEELVDPTFKYDPDYGFGLAAAVGYSLGRNFRIEAELACQQNYVYEGTMYASIPTPPYKALLDMTTSGDIKSFAGLINGYYDFTNHSAFTPFVSAGFGFVNVKMNDFTVYTVGGEPNPDRIVEDADGTAPAYQVGGGFGYALCDNLTFDFTYRYFASVNLAVEGGKIVPHSETDYISHNIYVGLRFSF